MRFVNYYLIIFQVCGFENDGIANQDAVVILKPGTLQEYRIDGSARSGQEPP